MHIAIWIVTLLLVGLWTLAAWGFSQLLAINGDWLTDIEPWLGRIPFGGWLESWFPEWLHAAHTVFDALQALLAWLGTAAPMLVWGLWLAGTLVMVVLAVVLSLLVALIRRTAPPQPPQQPPQQPPLAA